MSRDWSASRNTWRLLYEESYRVSAAAGGERLSDLPAPAAGAMDRRIAESVDAVLWARLEDRGRRIFEGTARPAGLETVGDLSLLVPGRP